MRGHIQQIGDEAVEPLALVLRRREHLVLASPRHRACRSCAGLVIGADDRRQSGVCRSWEIEVSRAERSRSVSASTRASSMSSASCGALDGASGGLSRQAHRADGARSGVQQRARPCAVDAERRRRRPGRSASAGTAAWRPAGVSAPRPAGLIVVPAPSGRRRDPPRRAVLGRVSRRARAIESPSARQEDDLRRFSIEAIWWAVAHSRSSSRRCAASLRLKRVERLGRPALPGAR